MATLGRCCLIVWLLTVGALAQNQRFNSLTITSAVTNNGILTNNGVASFRTNQFNFGTNEGRWLTLHGNANTNSLFDDQYLTAVNPDIGFTTSALDGGVGNWKLVSTRYPVNPGNRDNIVYRDGYNPTREVTNEVTACQTFETVWYPDGPTGRRQCEWYFSFSDNRTPWADNRKIAVNFNATNVFESRTALLDTRVDIAGETTFMTDREGTNTYAQFEDVGLGEGGQTGIFGTLSLLPYLPPGGVHTATYLRFNNTNSLKHTLVRQNEEKLLFERQDGSTNGVVSFENIRQVNVPWTNNVGVTIVTNGLGVGTNNLGGWVHIGVSNDALGLLITKSKVETGGNIVEYRLNSGAAVWQVSDNGNLRGNSFFSIDTGTAFNLHDKGIANVYSGGTLGFTSGAGANGAPDTAFSRSAAANIAVGNGTAGNIAGTLTASNANYAGIVSATNRINVGSAASPPFWSSGAGTPEGAVTAPVGSLFSRTDGGAGTSLYVKESGTGNTGWVGK